MGWQRKVGVWKARSAQMRAFNRAGCYWGYTEDGSSQVLQAGGPGDCGGSTPAQGVVQAAAGPCSGTCAYGGPHPSRSLDCSASSWPLGNFSARSQMLLTSSQPPIPGLERSLWPCVHRGDPYTGRAQSRAASHPGRGAGRIWEFAVHTALPPQGWAGAADGPDGSEGSWR